MSKFDISVTQGSVEIEGDIDENGKPTPDGDHFFLSAIPVGGQKSTVLVSRDQLQDIGAVGGNLTATYEELMDAALFPLNRGGDKKVSSNLWIKTPGGLNVYLRWQPNRITGESIGKPGCIIRPGNQLVIANVNLDEDKRGLGIFTKFLNYVETRYNVQVECINEPRLVGFLKRRGYRFSSPTGFPFSEDCSHESQHMALLLKQGW